MKKIGLQSFILGAFVVASVIAIVSQGTSAMEARIVEGVETTLEGARKDVRSQLQLPRAELMREGASLASIGGLASDFEFYASDFTQSYSGQKTEATQNAKKQQRLLATKTRLLDVLTDFRSRRPGISGTVLLDTQGVAIVSDSLWFPVQTRLLLEENVALGDVAQGKSLYWLDVNTAGQFMARSLAPIRTRADVLVGLVMVEKQVSLVSAGRSIEHVFVMDGQKAVYGERPFPMKVPLASTQLIMPIAPSVRSSRIVGLGNVALPPLFVEPSRGELQAIEFAVPGAPSLRGFITLDPSGLYADLGGVQYSLIFFALLLSILNIGLGIATYKSAIEPVTSIADSIAATLQGTIVESVDDSKFSPELARLNQLVKKVVVKGKGAYGSGENRSDAQNPAPSVFDLYGRGSAITEFASMDFYGNLNSVNLDGLAFGPVSASAEIVGDEASVLSEHVESTQYDDNALGLQGASSALGIRDGSAVADLFSTRALDASGDQVKPMSGAVTDPGGELEAVVRSISEEELRGEKTSAWDDLGLEPLAEYSTDNSIESSIDAIETSSDESVDSGATSVMKVSPELMAQLRERDPEEDTDRSASFQPLGVNSELLSEVSSEVQNLLGPEGTMSEPVSFTSELTPASSPIAASVSSSQTLLEAIPTSEFKEVYDEFLATRSECGESINLPFEKFVARLEKSKEAVINKHGCRSVKFKVYVKNGRAALKASPIP